MKNRKVLWNLVCAGVLSAAFLGGCGKKDTSEQEAYRQYGINCMESGNEAGRNRGIFEGAGTELLFGCNESGACIQQESNAESGDSTVTGN